MLKTQNALFCLLPFLVAALALFVSYQDFLVWVNNGHYAAADPDPVMRYVRVFDLVQSGDWYDNIIRRDNYPYGDEVRWTRLFDLLVLAPAYLVKSIFHFDWKDAIYWTGCWISPVLQALSVLLLAWSVKPLKLKIYELGLLLLLFVFHEGLQSYFAFGRGDHHSLLIGLYILSLGSFLRLLGSLENRKYLFLTSAALAIGLWASPEQLVMIFLCMMFLGVLWLQNVPYTGRALFSISSALFIWTIGFILVEKPPHKFLLVEHDRVSIVHLAIFFIAATISWANNKYTSHCSWKQKSLLVVAEAAGAFLLLAVIFPRFYLGPYAAFDVRVITIWAGTLVEMQPILYIDDAYTLVLLVLGGIASISLTIAAIYSLHHKAFEKQKNVYLFLLLLMWVYSVLTCIAARWCYYIMPVLLICGAVIVGLLYRWLCNLTRIRYFYLLIAVIGTTYLASTLWVISKPVIQYDNRLKQEYRSCNAMLNYMLQSGELEKIVNLKDKVVWSNNSATPLFLYWTDAYTIGSNFTHNVGGIIDSMDLYTTADNSEFKHLLKKRKTDYLIACFYQGKSVKRTVMNMLALRIKGDGLGLKFLDYRIPAHPKAIQVNEKTKPRIYTVIKGDLRR